MIDASAPASLARRFANAAAILTAAAVLLIAGVSFWLIDHQRAQANALLQEREVAFHATTVGHNLEAARHLDNALTATSAAVPTSMALLARLQADMARVDAALGDHASANRLRGEAGTSLADIPEGPNTDRDVAVRLLAAGPAHSR